MWYSLKAPLLCLLLYMQKQITASAIFSIIKIIQVKKPHAIGTRLDLNNI